MGRVLMLGMGLVAASVATHDAGASLVDALLAESLGIRTIRCDVRREVVVDGVRSATLSRVWFKRPDRLRVETLLPVPRRIVVDGKTIYKWIDGEPDGVRLPLQEAPPGELLQVRRTPGTVDEHLMRLRGAIETDLPPSEGFPVRRGYQSPAPHPYTVLSMDETGRLAALEFLDPEDRSRRLLRTVFSGWVEPVPGIWIACVQRTTASGPEGTAVSETLRVSGLRVNEPMSDELFEIGPEGADRVFLTPSEMAVRLEDAH